MTTKHRSTMPRTVIEAFKAGDEDELDRLLGLKPWEFSPLDAYGPCGYPGRFAAANWQKAVALREELENLAQIKPALRGSLVDDAPHEDQKHNCRRAIKR